MLEILRKSKIARFILLIIILVGDYYIWKSDSFQKRVFPEKYWQKEVRSLERVIEFNEGIIRSAYRDLKKIQLTAKLEVADYVDSADLLGMTKKEAREAAIEKGKEDIEANRQMIKEMQEMNAKFKKELEHARRQLSKYESAKRYR